MPTDDSLIQTTLSQQQQFTKDNLEQQGNKYTNSTKAIETGSHILNNKPSTLTRI